MNHHSPLLTDLYQLTMAAGYWHHGRAQVDRSPSLGGARFSLIWPRSQPDQA